MNEEDSQKLAHHIHQLSMGLFELTLQVTNIILILHDVQDRIADSAVLIKEIVDDLPEEVREKTTIKSKIVLGNMDALSGATIKRKMAPQKMSLVELIKKILGGNHS